MSLSQFWIVRVERPISSAIARMEPPASFASRTAARISSSASTMWRAAVCSRRRCAGGMVAVLRPGFVGTKEIVAETTTQTVVLSATI